MSRPLLAILLMLSVQPCFGVYITDKLLAGFYAQPDSGAQPLRALASGTPLEILDRGENFYRVRLGDNSEGWVEKRFITAEKPAKVRMLELQAKNAELLRKIDGGQSQTAVERSQKNASVGRTASAQQQRLQRENAELGDTILQLKGQLDEHPQNIGSPGTAPGSRPPLWVVPLALLTMLIGFISGIAFKNYLIARRARSASRMKF